MKISNFLFYILFIAPSFCNAQTMRPPILPIEAEKVVVLNEMIKATKYENSFYSECINAIRFHGDTNKWDEQLIQKTMKSVNFSDFKPIFCSYFSYMSIEDINSITKLFSKLNKSKYPDGLIITNNSLQGELAFYIRTVIDGSYLR